MRDITTAIIIAAGDGTRWNNHLDVPKHFIPIEGEPLIKRTIRLLRERSIEGIHVVGPDDDRYRIPYTDLFIPVKQGGGLDKFLNSAELWNKEGRTLVIYGDVYFTDEAMDTIINYEEKEWRLFCSFNHGECFAQSFYPEHIEEHYKTLKNVAKMESDGGLTCVGGWSHYRRMCGIDTDIHGNYGRCIPIEDLTNDFDCAEDYTKFMKNMI
ncbi:MAG: NTP transferase domain-containing protein [bacterium]|nr:NTP transferase domain-containing protein [bacterium]